MESPVQIPSQLATLLSCGLCRRPYDLETPRLPKELVCRHSFCEDCLARSLNRETFECSCPICGLRTGLLGRKLPETTAIMFLLRELPALVLGRAMLDFSRGSSSHTEVEGEQHPADATSGNWLDQVCVNRFLASSREHCPIHAMPNSTWCHNCQFLLCSGCADAVTHRDHRLTRQLDYPELLRQLLSAELSKIKCAAAGVSDLAARELHLLRQLCEACLSLHRHVTSETRGHKASLVSQQMNGLCVRAEYELNSCVGLHSVTDLRNLLSRLVSQRRQCERQLMQVHFQCRMRAAIQENGMQVLDFKTLNERLLKLQGNLRPGGIPANVEPPPALVLTNYCVYVYWDEMHNRLMPSDPLLESRVGREMTEGLERYFFTPENFNRDREGSNNSVSSSASNSSSYASIHSLQSYENMNQGPQFQSQSHFQWQRQRQREMNLRQVEQQQQLAAFRQDDPNWNHGMPPILDQHNDSRSRHLVSIARPPSVHCYPIYYMDMDMAGELAGRVLVEVRDDVAPRMSKNFGALVRHDRGYGYRGCSIFQAWGGESIISGDFECNNGRGGHSTLDSRYFMPDDTRLPAHRGTVGMRRGQRRQDRSGFVGSQFRVVLNEMRSFTAIFGYIVDGIEVVDRVAATGNAIGRLAVTCTIRNCGEYFINR